MTTIDPSELAHPRVGLTRRWTREELLEAMEAAQPGSTLRARHRVMVDLPETVYRLGADWLWYLDGTGRSVAAEYLARALAETDLYDDVRVMSADGS